MPKVNADEPAEKASKRGSGDRDSKKDEFDSKQTLSMEEILRFFLRSNGIVTIGLCKIILSDTRERGIAGFSEVMQKLYRIYTERCSENGVRTSFAWMARTSRGETALSEENMELFQECYLELPEEIRAWLSARSVIFLASPRRGWEAKEIYSALRPPEIRQRKSDIYSADDFFRSFGMAPWKSLQAATAFPLAADQGHISYLGHYLDGEAMDPIAIQRISRSPNRDKLVMLAHNVSQSFEAGRVDSSAALELLKAGFTGFSFEEFSSLKIN